MAQSAPLPSKNQWANTVPIFSMDAKMIRAQPHQQSTHITQVLAHVVMQEALRNEVWKRISNIVIVDPPGQPELKFSYTELLFESIPILDRVYGDVLTSLQMQQEAKQSAGSLRFTHLGRYRSENRLRPENHQSHIDWDLLDAFRYAGEHGTRLTLMIRIVKNSRWLRDLRKRKTYQEALVYPDSDHNRQAVFALREVYENGNAGPIESWGLLGRPLPNPGPLWSRLPPELADTVSAFRGGAFGAVGPDWEPDRRTPSPVHLPDPTSLLQEVDPDNDAFFS